jgi:hypothetical protein
MYTLQRSCTEGYYMVHGLVLAKITAVYAAEALCC